MSFLNTYERMRKRREKGGKSENIKKLRISPDFQFLLEIVRVFIMGLVMEKWQRSCAFFKKINHRKSS